MCQCRRTETVALYLWFNSQRKMRNSNKSIFDKKRKGSASKVCSYGKVRCQWNNSKFIELMWLRISGNVDLRMWLHINECVLQN